jgi:hypothetical protein
MSAYVRPVSMTKLFVVLVALATLFAPGVAGAAMAAAPHHGMAMMEAGHCQAPASGSGHHDQSDGKSCCVWMCMALAVAPSPPAEVLPQRREMPQFASAKAYHGLPAEIATPPPRHA